MAEEHEYYWDEESQAYWYWDEASQAYYAYEEDTGNAAQNNLTYAPTQAASTEKPPKTVPAEEPDQPPVFERKMSRMLSFKDHGGLVGCVQEAARQRERRASFAPTRLDDESIRLENKLTLAREMASASVSSSNSTTPSSTRRSSTSSVNRPSNVRFGTQEFSDPLFQERLQQMLGSKPK